MLSLLHKLPSKTAQTAQTGLLSLPLLPRGQGGESEQEREQEQKAGSESKSKREQAEARAPIRWRMHSPDVLVSDCEQFTICRSGPPTSRTYLAWRRREHQVAELLGAFGTSNDARAAIARRADLDQTLPRSARSVHGAREPSSPWRGESRVRAHFPGATR